MASNGISCTADEFVRRHVGPDDAQIRAMLEIVGAASLDALIKSAAPASILSDGPLNLPAAMSEADALQALRELADANRRHTSMIGMGYYGTHVPAVIRRNVLENPGWYTAYTPYQAEVSQGRLEALLNYQQMIIDLTGLPIANASLLDEATAAAEAMAMAKRVARTSATAFFVDADCHPQTLAVLKTRADAFGLGIIVGDPEQDLEPDGVFGAMLHYPGSSGQVRDFSKVIAALHQANALAIVATDLLSLTLLTPPGELGADIAIGSAQRFGVPMGYGGPHAAFFATREPYKRAMPGRIIGVSIDRAGRPALRMALQTREQHIRREKATSNICTAQVLLAVMAGFYAVYHGPDGLTRIAARVHLLTRCLAKGLRLLGRKVETSSFFDTITIALPDQADAIADRALLAGINLRRVDSHRLGIALDETTKASDVERLFEIFADGANAPLSVAELSQGIDPCLPESLERQTPFLTHPVFARHRSETEMMRYLARLQAKDLALDRTMIPLGSCTMKLNAAAEMTPISWDGFSTLHPFAPRDQAKGYHRLFADLQDWLKEITGFDAVSLQPNAGSQGEYAGLLTIRAFQRAAGEGDRNICLIPASAHGTNPASAQMAGLNVVVVACDDRGNVDLDDLKVKAAKHGDALAALMITYPSTHGVFEESIRDICQIVHEQGAQVYFDGANLNALVGLSRPAELGADVAHLNLHKTFCIPHGGGGPGMGPIGVKAHLAPYLPGHAVADNASPLDYGKHAGQVSAAPFGSPLILPISWAYIAMMGARGLRHATKVAILNANYVAARLASHYPIVYVGQNGRVAHECIVDLRGIKQRTGIGVEDVAKRLIDYGFHAPTMSWPVSETLMIEPTESESKDELDRFCEAMIKIREEIAVIEAGGMKADDSPLRHAPHTVDQLLGEWRQSYSKESACFPVASLRMYKYWAPVARIDNAHGDRHLVCSCPPLEAYQEAAE